MVQRLCVKPPVHRSVLLLAFKLSVVILFPSQLFNGLVEKSAAELAVAVWA